MPQNHSACIPPPSDYTPRARPPNSFKSRDRGGRGKPYGRRGQPTTTFQKDQSVAQRGDTRNQPEDKFHRTDDEDYFALVQDEEEIQEANNDKRENDDHDDDDEDDPLDAFMKSLEGEATDKSVKSQSNSKDNSLKGDSVEPESGNVSSGNTQEAERRAIRLDIDGMDDIEESYYQYVEQIRTKKNPAGDQEGEELDDRQNMVEYDNDGNIISVQKSKREIDPLPNIDHSSINYAPFKKVFYQEHSEIEKLTEEQGQDLRSKLDIKVSGESPPKPVCSFAHFGFDEQLMKVIRRSEYTQPTPIQAQAIPAALLGRNIIGIAMTGSGKTAAYLWPMMVHIMEQPDLKRGDGPIALVLVPTRELALQVYGEAKKFSSSYKIAVVCAYGGGSKYEQSKDLEAGAEIVVATPGRIIDLIKSGVTNLRRVTYLVLDEADRFFEMGFEAQVRSICDHIRPDRQTLLFSATFKKKIEQLARTVTENPVKIVQRSLGEANEDVTQHVIMISADGTKKWNWLLSKLVEFTSAGSVLIFVTRILNSEELHNNLKEEGKDTLLLHGDMEQSERNRVIMSFKRKEKDVMIATDVAARGLDISHIRTVINYDVARDIDTHIHRVGRTGRAGSKGDAYTLITGNDKEFAGHLVKNLESSNQKVDEDLMKLAMQSHTFRKSRPNKHHHHHRGHQGSSTSSHHHRNHHGNQYESRHNRYTQDHSRSYGVRKQPHHGRDSSPHRSSSSSMDSHNPRRSPSSSHHDHRKRSRWH